VRDFVRYAKAWALVNMITRLALVVGVTCLVMAMLFGSGGEFAIKWSFNQ
jgi:hypothetical protein